MTRAGFLKWLREQDPGRKFYRGSFCRCPIAEYIDETLASGAEVCATYWVMPPNIYKELPQWAQKFIYAIDSDKTTRTITAAECIRLLGATP